jgi:hypothetical protein
MINNDNKRRLEILEQNPSLGDKFQLMIFGKVSTVNMEVLKGAILSGIASQELLTELRLFVPICYKINGTVFLLGNESEETWVGGTLVELFNMTEEMKTGNSYSLYVNDVSYFAYADAGETEQVKNYFDNRK